MKTCSKCNVEKPFKAFRKRKGSSDGYHGWCTPCNIEYSRDHYQLNKETYQENFKKYAEENKEALQTYKSQWYSLTGRDRGLKKFYGISLEQYNEILQNQNGGCYICNKTPEENGRNLAVDHSHKDGRIRGLLCTNCNKFLVSHYEDGEIFKKAGEYILSADTGYIVPAEYLKGIKKKRKKRKIVSK